MLILIGKGGAMRKSRPPVWLFFALMLNLAMPGLSLGLDIGDKAPGFSGNSTRGTVQLSDFSGERNVVLALYFAAFTPV
jgi:hypothetical protein